MTTGEEIVSATAGDQFKQVSDSTMGISTPQAQRSNETPDRCTEAVIQSREKPPREGSCVVEADDPRLAALNEKEMVSDQFPLIESSFP